MNTPLNPKIEELISAVILALQTPPEEDIPTWLGRNLYLPSDTAEPGIYNADRAPYQKYVLQCASPSNPTRRITLCFGTQMGKTLIEEDVNPLLTQEYLAWYHQDRNKVQSGYTHIYIKALLTVVDKIEEKSDEEGEEDSEGLVWLD